VLLPSPPVDDGLTRLQSVELYEDGVIARWVALDPQPRPPCLGLPLGSLRAVARGPEAQLIRLLHLSRRCSSLATRRHGLAHTRSPPDTGREPRARRANPHLRLRRDCHKTDKTEPGGRECSAVIVRADPDRRGAPSAARFVPSLLPQPAASAPGACYPGIAPICCMRLIVSVTPQCSATLPSSRRMMSMLSTSTVLPVAATPMNSPW
jgi:hypothetical protein